MFRVRPLVALVVLPLGFACSEPAAPPAAPQRVVAPSFGLVTTEIERAISAEEFAMADKDGASDACAKGTPSGNVLMKDANASTPSQPCPPGWQLVGKPGPIKFPGEWYTEDKNGNGTVCVKVISEGKTIIKDDNPGTPSQPCPPAFSVVGKAPQGPTVDEADVLAADDDGDGQVCVNAVASGNFIVHDDNNATPSQPCPPSFFLYGKAPAADPGVPEAPPGKD